MRSDLSLTEQLFYTTIRIECLKKNGSTSIGTGFVYIASDRVSASGQNESLNVLISNNHVVEDSILTTIWFHILDKDGNILHGMQRKVELEGDSNWIKHNSLDLAFLGLYLPIEILKRQGYNPFFLGIADDLIPKPEEWSEIMPGEEVMMVGYPIGLWDSVNNLPILRRGTLASLPYINFENKKEFMIDCACFPGSSGSPVFLVNLGRKITRKGVQIDDFDTKLIGILWGGPIFSANGKIIPETNPTSTDSVSTNIMINLGYCIKSFALFEIEAMLISIVEKNQTDNTNILQQKIIDSFER